DESVNLRLDYHYNDLQDLNQFYRRSDHWNFGRFGVPFVFFFTGVHEDYHQPSDQVEKVDFPKLTKTTRLLYSSTVQVANYESRPEVDNQDFIDITKNLPR
ncbi:MAG: M28 family peptidase, partial [Balneolaceae bacterium]